MRNTILSLLAFATLAPLTSSSAQQSAAEPDPVTAALEIGRSILDAERQAVIAEALPLTREEGEKFWPLYREYHTEADKIMGRRLELIRAFTENFENVTDAFAEDLIKGVLKNDEAETQLKQKYFRRFQKVLPSTKLLLYYQLENKIDTHVRARFVEQIPLLSELDR